MRGAVLALIIWVTLIPVISVLAQTAPDATAPGPFETTSAEYKFAASVDTDVLADLPTELWARVYRPADLSSGPFPLLIFLHGNHATCGYSVSPRVDDNCQYTFTGNCPLNYVVAPSHVGYSYLADRLASWGYIVVSINANRGINCRNDGPVDAGLNLARGRLILRHLQRLSEWHRNVSPTPASLGVSLVGKLDFNSVGLMGHSRGGEGVRAAYNQFRDMGSPWPARIPGLTIQAIFEIGPVDGQTSRVLNADGTVWNVLLPMCDGDVSNLQGVRPFDRMMQSFNEDPPTQKSTYTVWGTNHNYYNTEWQESDSSGCFGTGNLPLWSTTVGSPQQRQTALASVLAFFRGNVGPDADPTFNQNFNPQYNLPPAIRSVTRVDRGYTDSPNAGVTAPFEDFDQPTGTNTYGAENDALHVSVMHGTVPDTSPAVQRGGIISWVTPGANTYFQTNWSDPGSGVDVRDYQTLDLRVARQDSTLNPNGPTNFSIRLVQANGTLSQPVQLIGFTDLRGPVGGLDFLGNPNLHPILQTVRIRLTAFGGVDLSQIRGIRFTFDSTESGGMYLANIRLSSLSGSGLANVSAITDRLVDNASQLEHPVRIINNEATNAMSRIQTVPTTDGQDHKAKIEIAVVSSRSFPVRDELPVLRIGTQEFLLSRYPESGDTHELIFTLTGEEFAQTSTGEEVTLQYGRGPSNAQWRFGQLDKSLLDK